MKSITYNYKNATIEKKLETLLDDNTLLFDTETSGLASNNPNPKQNKEIVELALIDRHGNTVYHSLFKPEEPISGTLAIVNNIDNEKLKDAPLWKDEWPKICSLMNGKRIVGFNNASFDNQALDETCARYGIGFKSECRYETVDVMPIFMKFTNLFPQTYNKSMMIKQEVARNILDLTSVQTHRADDDCRDLLELIQEMKNRLREKKPVSAQKFIDCLPTESGRKKYSTLLQKEKRNQEFFNELRVNKHNSLDYYNDEYSDIGSPQTIESMIIKMNEKGIINMNDKLDVDDEMRNKIIEHFDEYHDVGQASIDLGVDMVKVRNVVMHDLPYDVAEKKTVTTVKLESLTNDETKILDEYARLKIEIDINKQHLESYEKTAMNVFDKTLQMDDLTISGNEIKIDFKAAGKVKKTFDTAAFKRECPYIYEEFLKKDDNDNPVMTKPRETVRFKPNKEYIVENISKMSKQEIDERYPEETADLVDIAINISKDKPDISSFVFESDARSIIDNISRLEKDVKELEPLVKNIIKENNCNRIDTKIGRFTFSKSKPGYSLDIKKLDAAYPELRSNYMKSDIQPDTLAIKKAGRIPKKANVIDIDEWKMKNESLIKNINVSNSYNKQDNTISIV